MIYRVLILSLLVQVLSQKAALAVEENTGKAHTNHACFVYDGTEDGVLLEPPLDVQIGATTGTFFGTLEQLEEKRAEDREAQRQYFEDHPEHINLSTFHTAYVLAPTPIYGGTFVESLSKGEVFCQPLIEHRSDTGTGYEMDKIVVRQGGNDNDKANMLFGPGWYVSERPSGFIVYFTEEEMPESGIVFFPFSTKLGRLESFTPIEPSAAQLSAARAKITSQTLE